MARSGGPGVPGGGAGKPGGGGSAARGSGGGGPPNGGASGPNVHGTRSPWISSHALPTTSREASAASPRLARAFNRSAAAQIGTMSDAGQKLITPLLSAP